MCWLAKSLDYREQNAKVHLHSPGFLAPRPRRLPAGHWQGLHPGENAPPSFLGVRAVGQGSRPRAALLE